MHVHVHVHDCMRELNIPVLVNIVLEEPQCSFERKILYKWLKCIKFTVATSFCEIFFTKTTTVISFFFRQREKIKFCFALTLCFLQQGLGVFILGLDQSSL